MVAFVELDTQFHMLCIFMTLFSLVIAYIMLLYLRARAPCQPSHTLLLGSSSHLSKPIPCLLAIVVIVIITAAIIVTKWSLQGTREESSVCWSQ